MSTSAGSVPRAADEARRPGPDAEAVDGGLGGVAQERVVGEAEVVVGGEVDQATAFGEFDRAVGAGLHLAQAAVQGAFAQGGQFTLEGITHQNG